MLNSSLKLTLAFVLPLYFSACQSPATMHTTPLPKPSPAAIQQLAPSGTLRAAINLGNPILANKNAQGEPVGVSVDLARTLAAQLSVPLVLVVYDAAGKVVADIKNQPWDIAFLAIDPLRGNEIDYSAPYVVIEGAYLVKNNSPITRNEQVDVSGIRISAAKGSAYDLYLSRELKQAKIVHAPTSAAVVDMFLAQNLDVAAGVKQQLQADAARLGGVRLLDGRFMVINQAMGTLKNRPEGVAYLHQFVEAQKASGFVADALKRHKIEGAAVGALERRAN